MFEGRRSNSFWSNISSKASFWLGFIGGILLMFVIGFFVLLAVVVNSDDQLVFDNNQPLPTNNQPTNNANAPSQVSLRSIGKNEVVRGNRNASVVMIEFSDYQCPFCSRMHDTMKQVMDEYGDQVAWVYRHFPLDSIHPTARKAAEAAECANDQGKFWEYSDAIFDNQNDLAQGESALRQLAADIGLKQSSFDKCLDSGKYASKVQADYQEGIRNGVTGTPGTFINGQLVKGAVSFSSLKQIIDQALE